MLHWTAHQPIWPRLCVAGTVLTRLTSWLLLLPMTMLTIGCGSTSVTEVSAPGGVRCQTTLGTRPTIPAPGGRFDVGVLAARECLWDAASDTSWLQVTPNSGQGEAPITLTAAANPAGVNRSGNVIVNGARFTVAQEASPCTFSLGTTSASVPAAGGSVAVRVESLSGCSWNTAPGADWARVTSAAGSGSGDVVIQIEANSGPARSTQLTIAGRSFTLSQNAASSTPASGPSPSPGPSPTPGPAPTPGPIPPPTPVPACTYTLDPSEREIRERGGTNEGVRLTTGLLCAWTASSDVSWISLRSLGVGLGSAQIRYDVDRNRDGRERTGTITIGGQRHTVRQRGED